MGCLTGSESCFFVLRIRSFLFTTLPLYHYIFYKTFIYFFSDTLLSFIYHVDFFPYQWYNRFDMFVFTL